MHDERPIDQNRKLAKEPGRTREEWETIFQAIGHPAIILDSHHKVIAANSASLKITGKPSHEILGKQCYEIFHGKDTMGPPEGCPMDKILKSGHLETTAMEIEALERVFFVSCTPVLDEEGNLEKIIHIATDITERKRAEQALSISEENYRSLFEESKDVVYISAPNGTFIDINPAGVALFDYVSKEELLSIDLSQQLYANSDDRNKFVQTIESQGFVKDYEVLMKKKNSADGVIVSITSIAVKDDRGKIISYRGIMRDMTEHRRLEEQLFQSQKLDAVGQLAGGVAHDFNNILSAIVGYAHLTLMKLPEDDPLRGNLEQILQASDKAATLTKSLLSFSRKQIILPKTVDLNSILRKLELFLMRLIREDIEITTSYAGSELIVLADSGQIEQMLINLVTNARDAMPKGGHIALQTESVQMDKEFIEAHGYGKPGKYALILVSDTGEGMDAKTRERIFEPFFTTKEQGKGTGLGLSMVYGIVKQHGGYIDVYSEQDRDTTFKIYLPLHRGVTKEEQQEAEVIPVKNGSEAILIAEDNPALRKLTSAILRHYGYNVVEAVDGEDAVAKFRENKDRIVLIILDGIMPKKNGKEAYEEIRIITPSIRTIFISGYAEDIFSKKGLLDPGINFIQKPVRPADLLKKVREVLDA